MREEEEAARGVAPLEGRMSSASLDESLDESLDGSPTPPAEVTLLPTPPPTALVDVEAARAAKRREIEARVAAARLQQAEDEAVRTAEQAATGRG